MSLQAYTSEVDAYLSLYGNAFVISDEAERLFVAYGHRQGLKPKAIASIITRKNRGVHLHYQAQDVDLEDQAGDWHDGIHLARHLKRLTTLANNRFMRRHTEQEAV